MFYFLVINCYPTIEVLRADIVKKSFTFSYVDLGCNPFKKDILKWIYSE